MPLPPKLATLVNSYTRLTQQPVRFRPPSWPRASNDWLTSPTLTKPSRWRDGDRIIDAADLEAACGALSLEDRRETMAAFALVMAWGSGTSAPRSYRHTAAALADDRLYPTLRHTAELCRGSGEMTVLEEAYTAFRVDGVGRSFFTKWFRFAGREAVEPRAWQPLILDDRVLATLNRTLGTSTQELAGSHRWKSRYRAYVETLNEWADEVRHDGIAVTADRLEWIFFCHNGLTDVSAPSGRCS
jgi:hypothetical protein